MLHWAASPERDPGGPVPANLSPEVLGIAREAFRRGIEQTVYAPYHAGQNVVQACWTHTAFALSTARVAAVRYLVRHCVLIADVAPDWTFCLRQ